MSTQYSTDAAVAALRLYEAAHEDLFAQCCSNPIKNAWGKEVNLSKLNIAHEAAGRALNASPALDAPAALLTKPARVGGGSFGVGVPERYVIEAAQRHHAREAERSAMTAEEFADEEGKRRTLWELIHGPLAAAPQAPAAPAVDVLSQAVRDVLAERRRQVEAEGYDTEHDDAHVMGEIGALAALYLMPDGARDWDATSTTYGATLGQALLPENWTMPTMGEDRRRDLVKGIACGLAELERWDRVSAQANGGGAA